LSINITTSQQISKMRDILQYGLAQINTRMRRTQ
jgi:hypothetical protein